MPLPAAFANLHLIKTRPSAGSLKTAADQQRQAETRLKRKVEQAHHVLSQLEARAASYAAQIKELQRRKAASEKRAASVEDRILTHMQAHGLEKVEGIRVVFTTRLAQPSVIVDDVKLIPSDYLRFKQTVEADKVAIKAALERNLEVPGVHLAQTISLGRKA